MVKVTPHICRHTFATNMAVRGMNSAILKQIPGHDDISTTFSIYRVQMPKVTPHICRHTYCSNCARAGMNPKTLQYLMVHSDIEVTLNVYTHLGYEDAKEELSRINMAGTSKSHACKKQA